MKQASPNRFRASAVVCAALPRGIGRDLVETLYGGWLDDTLWSQYGDLDAIAYSRSSDINTERRLYADSACLARHAMTLAGAQTRSGTPFRIASTVIAELHGDLTRECRRCDGTGQRRGRERKPCRVCKGRGWLPPSLSVRAGECQCRLPEFRDRLNGVYLTVLSRLRRELEIAMTQYSRVEALQRAPVGGLIGNSLPADAAS